MQLVIIGAGGHAKVVLEACRAAGLAVLGLVDPGQAGGPAGRTVLGAPLLGDEAILPALRHQGVAGAVVAIGDNAVRQALGARLAGMGFSLPAVVHPAALISPSARLGAGVVVLARAVLGAASLLDDLALINTGAIVEHDNHIGAAAHVAPGCALAGDVWVGERALVGIGSAVRPGIRIGADAVVGAGAAVVAAVAAGQRVGGVPARPLRGAD
jgi:UDP-perosamine 4-acetyltransferase